MLGNKSRHVSCPSCDSTPAQHEEDYITNQGGKKSTPKNSGKKELRPPNGLFFY